MRWQQRVLEIPLPCSEILIRLFIIMNYAITYSIGTQCLLDKVFVNHALYNLQNFPFKITHRCSKTLFSSYLKGSQNLQQTVVTFRQLEHGIITSSLSSVVHSTVGSLSSWGQSFEYSTIMCCCCPFAFQLKKLHISHFKSVLASNIALPIRQTHFTARALTKYSAAA